MERKEGLHPWPEPHLGKGSSLRAAGKRNANKSLRGHAGCCSSGAPAHAPPEVPKPQVQSREALGRHSEHTFGGSGGSLRSELSNSY